MSTLASKRQRPVVFVGSSSEGEEVASTIQYQLHQACEPIVWNQDIFKLGNANLENLVNQLNKFDFAVLVFTPDDLVESRGETSQAPRDNVLLELGLFLGCLGRSRTFVVFDSDANLKIPTDLAGVSLASYEAPHAGTLKSALGPPCNIIREAIRNLGPRERPAAPPLLPPTPPQARQAVEAAVRVRVSENREILGAMAEPPSLDLWYTQLLPVVHQSAIYTTPTYFLDTNLNIIDWNIAFELVFSEITPTVRYRHVNEFIARLANFPDVFNHGRAFSRRVNAGEMPTCDTETIIYRSGRYGDVQAMKVATQLHDAKNNLRGWAVSLLLQEVEWDLLQKDLEERINEDKMWSIYASSYDRILSNFPPYKNLLSDVLSVVPNDATSVLDVGAGTGNCTSRLLEKGYCVVSLEQNSAMIEKMREKSFDPTKHRVIRAAAEHLYNLPNIEDETFHAAVLVNVLYSLQDPFACLTGVNRVLKPGGKIGLSTTHSGVTLDPLLKSIKQHLVSEGSFETCADDYQRIFDINKQIERTIARRVSAASYREMVQDAGFDLEPEHSTDLTYEGAVMVLHARKRR